MAVGWVSKTHGYKGEIKIVLTEGISIKPNKEPVFIEWDKKPVPYFLEKWADQGGQAIAKLKNIDSETAAAELTGKALFFEEKKVKRAKGSFDEKELIGLKITDQNGHPVGEVLAVENYNQLVIQTIVNGKEVLLPLNEDTLLKRTKTSIQLLIPEGLLEFYLGE